MIWGKQGILRIILPCGTTHMKQCPLLLLGDTPTKMINLEREESLAFHSNESSRVNTLKQAATTCAYVNFKLQLQRV